MRPPGNNEQLLMVPKLIHVELLVTGMDPTDKSPFIIGQHAGSASNLAHEPYTRMA